ncbi:MbtH family NRPS accessory protein [Streptomyces sp. Edi2]|uniref:MbtH family protein n=1 Tax=Streptomyces sp. Edi2 TaxID=3162528 RepID=UPI0033059124
MDSQKNETHAAFQVVVNGEEQYSLWPVGKVIPAGWRGVDGIGSKAECLKYITETWADMRPLSLRNTTEARGR